MEDISWELIADFITAGADSLSAAMTGVPASIAANAAWDSMKSAWNALPSEEQAAREREYAQLRETLLNAPKNQQAVVVENGFNHAPELFALFREVIKSAKPNLNVELNNAQFSHISGSTFIIGSPGQIPPQEKEGTGQEAVAQAPTSFDPTIEKPKVPTNLNLDHRQHVAKEIEKQLHLEGSEAMDYLLELLMQKLSLSNKPTTRDIADSLALVKFADAVGSTEYRDALNNSLTSLKHAIQDTVESPKTKKQPPSKHWCERMRKAMGALAQLSVDLNALQKQLDDQNKPGVKTPKHQAPTLALVANCYHGTNTAIILESDGFIGAGKFPLTPYPHAGAIKDAAQHALACLLKQIYHAVEEPGKVLKTNDNAYIQEEEIDDYIESIKQLLEANEKDGYACYAHIDSAEFKSQDWLNALLEIQRRIPLLMFQVEESAGQGKKTGLLIITDALCKRHLTDVWRCTENCQ